jgi:hypothetical protein
MAYRSYSCPTCAVVVSHALAEPRPATCPFCDSALPVPTDAAVAPLSPATGAAKAAHPVFEKVIPAALLLFLAGGSGLTISWLNHRGPAHPPRPQASPRQAIAEAADPEERLPPVARVDVARPAPARSVAVPRRQPAAPPPPPPAPPCSATLARRVNRAIDRGLPYLKHAARYGAQRDGRRIVIGDEGLLGLTLLECGVSPSDPLVRRMAAVLRERESDFSVRGNGTYRLSLAILFFDRLNDPTDRKRIRRLTQRLLSGQTRTGAWGYTCPPSSLLGESQYYDNSNSQFALLALWAARRRGLPVAPALARLARHFRTTQHPDGSWTYGDVNQLPIKAGGVTSSTCAGLMGLAVEHGLHSRPRDLAKPGGPALIMDDARDRGLRYLGAVLDRAPRDLRDAQRGCCGLDFQGRPFFDLYFLWSLERMAMMHGLRTIGETPWYPWAAELLVQAQNANGSWQNMYQETVDTCFALLVLRRTNFASDLTTALSGRIPGQDPLAPMPLPLTTHRPRPDLMTRPEGKPAPRARGSREKRLSGTTMERVVPKEP